MNNRCRNILFPTLLLTLISCSSPKDNEQLLIEAKTLISQNEKSEAAINLKNILQKEPEHSEARYLLGKIYLSADNYLSAEKEFKRAIANNPQNYQAILMLAKTQLSLSQFDNVINTLNLIDFKNLEDQIYSLLLTSQAYLSTDKIDLAKENINKANNLNSDSLQSILGNALIAAYENNTDEALSLLKHLLEKDSTFQEALLLKGSILSNNEQYQEAAEAYSAYYKLKPANFGIRTLVAHNYIKAGNFDAAKPHIEALLQINDNHPTINLLAAQVKYSDEDYQAAKELADKVVNSTNNALAQMISGLSSYQLKSYNQAYYQLNAIADLLPKDHRVHKVLALLQVKLGYTEELNETLAQFSNLTADDASLYVNIGRELANKGDKKAAQEMFSMANNLAPDNATIKAQLGIIKLLNTDKSGLDELKKAIKLDPDFKAANIALAMNYLKDNKILEAEKIADKWLKTNPSNTAAIILRGNIAMKSGNISDAKKYFNQALTIKPESIISFFNLAVITADEKKYSESNAYLDKLFSIDLEYPYAYRLAISNSLKENTPQFLEAKILKFIKESPNAIWPKVIMSRRLIIKKDYPQAISILETLTDYNVLPNFYFLALSNALLANNNDEKLADMYKKWQNAQPNNSAAFLSYIDILDQKKQYKLALYVTKEALSQEKLHNHFQLQVLEGYYLLATNQIETANKKITRLSTIEPNHAFLLRVQGQLALAQSNFPRAIDYLSRSLKLNKRTSTGLFLATAYRDNGQVDEAINFLETELKIAPNTPLFSRLLAELYVKNSPVDAINSYKKMIEKNPNDVVALNNIAWTYLEQNSLEQAYYFSAKAIELAPNHPQILDTYGIILTKTNRLPKALKVLTLAYELSPSNTEIIVHLADAYKADNQLDKAKELLKENNLDVKE
ncbi:MULTISPECIES: XrtA/PEP-CTERM system TPR-repeat protein PrsT [unclassified Colwellia]|jgi:putative PEP-CTERM system TPR-repeat lipoprotein|uniref:XrtA/PEP-CTERM system TPR-repeat protein PrsT n=1 Tax=unclassified Colwellia TaxID=196834 RepID=UPI0015F74C5C|nr:MULTISPECIES: XrtA/PEP-CTERM system TPR-repeat protein PrsT [unclassified Colwellia]MBA6252566.1 PEP-CTERM system TPR-repeat protein PrsT [Colwellia sp. MB3u-55]MBA6397208.1 PEP-CTERM system TPR-repeat protein PrsT [Colwellia sp. BRX10-4]